MRPSKMTLFLILNSLLMAHFVLANDCGLPGPDQVIIYEHVDRGGLCAVRGPGTYPDPSAFGLPNDAISGIDVGSNLRAVLYEDAGFSGRQAHFEGGFNYNLGEPENDETSSIEIFRKQGGAAATFFLGNYPHDRENFWSENAQGIANDGANWFITITGSFNSTPTLFKIPFSYDLNSGSAGGNVQRGMPSQLSSLGYNHFGDLDQAHGFLFVPVTGDGLPPQIAVFRTLPMDLAFLSSEIVPDTGGGWVAIRPGSNTLWVSGSDITEDTPVLEYEINWEALRRDGTLILKSPPKKISLLDRGGVPVRLQTMQGGVFNPEGTLLHLSSGYCDTFGFIDVFFIDGGTGILQASSENGYGLFNFETHPAPLTPVGGLCQGEEAEGIDFLDVRGLGLPGIPDGQLHVILIRNSLFEDDDLYFKHYEGGVNPSTPLPDWFWALL
jgi:hypothetical protein